MTTSVTTTQQIITAIDASLKQSNSTLDNMSELFGIEFLNRNQGLSDDDLIAKHENFQSYIQRTEAGKRIAGAIVANDEIRSNPIVINDPDRLANLESRSYETMMADFNEAYNNFSKGVKPELDSNSSRYANVEVMSPVELDIKSKVSEFRKSPGFNDFLNELAKSPDKAGEIVNKYLLGEPQQSVQEPQINEKNKQSQYQAQPSLSGVSNSGTNTNAPEAETKFDTGKGVLSQLIGKGPSDVVKNAALAFVADVAVEILTGKSSNIAGQVLTAEVMSRLFGGDEKGVSQLRNKILGFGAMGNAVGMYSNPSVSRAGAQAEMVR